MIRRLCWWGVLHLAVVAHAVLPETNRLDRTIQELGAPSYQAREAAGDQLTAWADDYPMYLLQHMADAYTDCSDMEIRTRLEALMEPLVQSLILDIPPGFIGINMTWNVFEDGSAAIGIGNLIQGQPAAKAGLKVGDLILKINGKSMAELGDMEGFVKIVASLPPGTPVELLIQRDDIQFLQPLVLGSRPDAVALRGSRQAMAAAAAYQDWLDEMGRLQDQDPDFPVGHFSGTRVTESAPAGD